MPSPQPDPVARVRAEVVRAAALDRIPVEIPVVGELSPGLPHQFTRGTKVGLRIPLAALGVGADNHEHVTQLALRAEGSNVQLEWHHNDDIPYVIVSVDSATVDADVLLRGLNRLFVLGQKFAEDDPRTLSLLAQTPSPYNIATSLTDALHQQWDKLKAYAVHGGFAAFENARVIGLSFESTVLPGSSILDGLSSMLATHGVSISTRGYGDRSLLTLMVEFGEPEGGTPASAVMPATRSRAMIALLDVLERFQSDLSPIS